MNQSAFKAILFSFLFALSSSSLFGQLNNQVFEQKDTLTPNDTQTVKLHFESLSFLRNTEYFDIIEVGQTYFGTLLQMHLSFQPYKNVLVKGGIQTKQDFGSNSFQSIAPVFSVSIFKPRWRHNFGMLQATTNFGLIEPMFSIDRAITNRVENGMQHTYNYKGTYFTNWLVWNVPIYHNSNYQEQFNVGVVLDKKLYNKKGLKISYPLQGTLAHKGGQINIGNAPIYSRVNIATGLKIKYTFNKNITIRTEHYWLSSQDFSPSITQPYKNGNASWHTLSLKVKNVEWMLNYWAGREWQSPIGSPLFNNYNPYDVYEYRQVRHMAFARVFYTKKIKQDLFLDIRFEPFYDFEYKGLQYSYSVYLKLNINKTLGKI